MVKYLKMDSAFRPKCSGAGRLACWIDLLLGFQKAAYPSRSGWIQRSALPRKIPDAFGHLGLAQLWRVVKCLCFS